MAPTANGNGSSAARKRIIILGAAGRDYHFFNTHCRQASQLEVVAFTHAQVRKCRAACGVLAAPWQHDPPPRDGAATASQAQHTLNGTAKS